MKFTGDAPPRVRPYSAEVEGTEALPFRVRLVESAQDLENAVEIRSSAYSRHVPSVGRVLRVAEADDHRPDVLLLIAERKADKHVLGSVRMQPNRDKPLRIEGETTLPAMFDNRRLMEFMRLGIENGSSGRLVMAALVKAGYEICHGCDIEFVLVAGRRCGAIYRSMCFDDVLQGKTVLLSYAGNFVPHGIFCIPVRDADRRCRDEIPGCTGFMAQTEHPDIEINFDRVLRTFGRP